MRPLLLIATLAACSSAADDLKALASDPAPCETDADCCVVTDGCLATSYVIGKADFAKAKDLAAEASKADTCVGCISPSVEVYCDAGIRTCTGIEVNPDDPQAGALAADHCGALLPERAPAQNASVLGCTAE